MQKFQGGGGCYIGSRVASRSKVRWDGASGGAWRGKLAWGGDWGTMGGLGGQAGSAGVIKGMGGAGGCPQGSGTGRVHGRDWGPGG